MPGYRFCRSDDLPLLVAAHDACWVPHFGGDSAITLEDFKRGIREIGLWSSSCMVAFEGDEPIGVLIAAKRDGDANYVHRLAVKPGWERQGHGRHLLTSLVDKAAILGPARVVVEIPAEWAAVRPFFAKSGFVAEARYVDFVLDPARAPDAAGDDPRAALVVPIGLDEVLESGAFTGGVCRAWRRTPASLRARAGEIEGLAVATDRLEAWVLFRPTREDPAAREVVALGAAEGAPTAALLTLLLAHARSGVRSLRIPSIAESEVDFATLAGLGFQPVRETIGYAVAR